MGDSSKSNFYAKSKLQVYGWRTILVEFLCCMVVVTWYLLFLAERITLRALTRLEKLAPQDDTLSRYGRATNVLFHGEGSYAPSRTNSHNRNLHIEMSVVRRIGRIS